MDEKDLTRQRLISVLDYDGVPKHRRASFLVNNGKVSLSTAYRLLNEPHTGRVRRHMFDLAQGLNVDWQWLGFGEFSRFDLRTMRIHVQVYKGYHKEHTDRIMRMFFGYMAGHRKAVNLFNLAAAGELSFTTAAALL